MLQDMSAKPSLSVSSSVGSGKPWSSVWTRVQSPDVISSIFNKIFYIVIAKNLLF